MSRLLINNRWIGDGELTYFVADIAANHDGKLERARKLIDLAKESGADAVKFQNFRAPKIVSKYGFESLGSQLSHQSKWKKSVVEVYADASIPWDWTPLLKEYCDKVGITYFSAPYDLEAVDMLDPFVPVFKIGSGDITWPEMLEKIARTKKPVMLATGASDLSDVQRAVSLVRAINPNLVLMQCNTNYTGSLENFRYIALNVLKTYSLLYPDLVLGLSDHTPGHATVLGAVTLGARVIEKHFADDTEREGPDHGFSIDPKNWKEMVARTRELECALGSPLKRIEENERTTAVIQRRCIRAARELPEGAIVTREMLSVLRPATVGAIPPYELPKILGKKLRRRLQEGEHLTYSDLQ